ncbi:sensor histidine kinase [Rhodoferax saidenbachensis]|uniref:histidine kinase n=1 Tax=Rhodoferax saidenbachensis TaxID=1484693 RepID=A0A1P8KAL9_9BURK|nr:sensor histidine kinase [Rhodoferax saidenbachensis]APW43015.1 histidine kinase [Rhodoferax saidenbachensis]
MFSNWIRRASIRVRLLALLLPTMALVTVVSLWLTRADAIASANAAYDRSLLGAIKALDLNVSTASGGLSVELPYRLFEFFQLTATGNVYFRVATADSLVEIGSPDLPKPPSPLRTGVPTFYDATYFGESVRVGAFMRPLEQSLTGSNDAQLVIQVAESTASREQFTAVFVNRAALRDLLLLALIGASVVIALTVALRPITRLAVQTKARGPDDLRPLQAEGLPEDIRPLVDAINQQLERTNRLVIERRGFIDDASHQLRTPLTVLRAQLDYVLREPDPEQRQAALEALSEEMGNTIRATNQLLTLARTDAADPQWERFDLGDLAREVALELLPLARARGVDLGVNEQSEPLEAHGDRGMLQHALINIAHNAIQHGLPQGVVTLHVAADRLGFSLQVIDNGPGMDPVVLNRLGQRFVKSRGSRGSGLGLAIAHAVIERHAGRLRVEPAQNATGCCVALWWPRV